MDQNIKILIEKLFDLFKDFLKLVLGEEKYGEVESDIEDIFGDKE